MFSWGLKGRIYRTLSVLFFSLLILPLFSFVVLINRLVLPSINYFRESNIIEFWS